MTRPGSAAGPAGRTRPAGVGSARRGRPARATRGSRSQSWLGFRLRSPGGGDGAVGQAGAPRRPPLPPEPATQSGPIALWRTRGSRGAGVGCSCVCSRAGSPGRKVSPALTAGGCQAPHLWALVLGTRALGASAKGACAKGRPTEGFVNGASARRLRLADAKGLVSRRRRKAIYGRVVGFPSVYAEPLLLGTRSNPAFYLFFKPPGTCSVKRKKEV